MMQVLRIDEIAMSLNKYRNEHFHQLNRLKQNWNERVKILVLEQGIQPVEKVIITYEFYFMNKAKRDADNTCVTAKFTNDALVHAGILKDDSFKHIQELRFRTGGVSRPSYVNVYLEEIHDKSDI